MADQWQRAAVFRALPKIRARAVSLQGTALHDGNRARAAVFVDNTLWPEYLELQAALQAYLDDATERIIREEVYGDAFRGVVEVACKAACSSRYSGQRVLSTKDRARTITVCNAAL